MARFRVCDNDDTGNFVCAGELPYISPLFFARSRKQKNVVPRQILTTLASTICSFATIWCERFVRQLYLRSNETFRPRILRNLARDTHLFSNGIHSMKHVCPSNRHAQARCTHNTRICIFPSPSLRRVTTRRREGYANTGNY